MSKAETLRQSAQARNESRIEQLASQVETVHSARVQSAEELSALLEPLAQAMAALSADTAKTLTEIDRQAQETSTAFQLQVSYATESLNKATAQAQQAAAGLNRAANRQSWSHYSLALLTGLVSAGLVSGFWLWYRPPTVVNPLDAKALAEYVRPALSAPAASAAIVKPARVRKSSSAGSQSATGASGAS